MTRRSNNKDCRFSVNFRGKIIDRNEPSYDEMRKLFNGQIESKPEIIIICIGVADIIEAFEYVKNNKIPFVIRGGGHSVAGRSTIEGGAVIDLREMRSVIIDPINSLARCEPGSTMGDLDRESSSYKLATTGGIISCTGVGGLVLGGGVGWLMGKHGLACDNLVSARILLADGRIVTASSDENPDLLWVLKGGGGEIGIVLEFVLKLYPIEKVYCGTTKFPINSAISVLKYYSDFVEKASDNLTLDCVLSSSEDGKQYISIDGCYSGNKNDVDPVVNQIMKLPNSIYNDWEWRPYWEYQRWVDDDLREGRRSYWKSSYMETLDDSFILNLVEEYSKVPSVHTILTFDHLHGAVVKNNDNQSSFGHREYKHLFLINTNWITTDQDDTNITWTKELFSKLNLDNSHNGYINYLGFDEGERIHSSFIDPIKQKLEKIRLKYDPEGLFQSYFN